MQVSLGLLAVSGLVFVTLCQGQTAEFASRHPTFADQTIWQASENPTWVENLALRSNGNILFSLVTEPSIYQLDDPLGRSQSTLIYEFPDVTSALGITEIAEDVFAVVVGNFSLTTVTGTVDTYSIWKVDFSKEHHDGPTVSKIANISEAVFLNGITSVSESSDCELRDLDTVLIADSALGTVWKLDPNTGSYERTISLPEMLAPVNASIDIGINGLAVRDGFLYWTNLAMEAIYSVAVESSTWTALPNAQVRTVAGNLDIAVDDFTFDRQGNIYSAGGDTVIMIPDASDLSKSNIQPVVVAGTTTSLTVAGSTSVRFGGDVLYVTTDGGMAAPVNGSVTEAGKIVALIPE